MGVEVDGVGAAGSQANTLATQCSAWRIPVSEWEESARGSGSGWGS